MPTRRPDLNELSAAELLELRFCELGLSIRQSSVGEDIDYLYQRLRRRGIRFRPHVWLSTEWFSPDGIPGIAIPFYAAHPRLTRLERKMKGEAEGGNRRWRRRILFHEAGHAIDTAYALRRRADWRAVFGRASSPYPRAYAVRPASRRYVQHLGHWYAQSHPTEDFAETFAVWLQPRARWQRDYADWPALGKLEYVDDLMREVGARRPRNADRSTVATLARNRRTLREHYRRQRPSPSEHRYDEWLKRAFARKNRLPDGFPAGAFIDRVRAEIRPGVLRSTGAGRYLFDHASDTLARRARELELVIRGTRRDARKTVARLHERVIEDLLRRNRERYVI